MTLGLLFRDWPGYIDQGCASGRSAHTRGLLQLHLQTVDDVGRSPESTSQIFADQSSQTSVFQGEHGWQIYFGTDAVAHIPIQADDDSDVKVTVQVAEASLSAGRLEDIIFSSLAPLLRARGLFMVHAFTVEKEGSALLFVGESGSGKTTTGLGLLSHGWRYLANDVTLVAVENGSVFALPTPGGIGLDLNSMALLWDRFIQPDRVTDNNSKYYYPATSLVAGWGERAPVRHILFPRVEADNETLLSPVASSVGLARLMEASVDRWDKAYLSEHIRVMALLSQQARGFDLRVGRNLERLPGILDQMHQHESGASS